MHYVIQLLAIVCLAALQAGPASAEKRAALVIGNAGYRAVMELPNPRKDARDIATALRAAGFTEVVEHYDLGLREMHQALSQFEDKAAGADWGVVYYAGHGIEVDGRNFLVPVDAELKRANDVEDETVALDRVLSRVAAAGKLQLIILDACRENPFRRRMAQAGGVKRAVGERGLARIEPAHPNVIVAYAARDGEVALDGKAGGNSPYARALLKHLAEPGLELGRFFRKVRVAVLAETGGRQRPFEYGSLTEDLFFKPGAPPLPSAAAEAARICREVEGMSSLSMLVVLANEHRGTPAGRCIEARLTELRRAEAERQRLALLQQEEERKRAEARRKADEDEAARGDPALSVKPGSGKSFRDCPDCPEMVVVPAGSFVMGSPSNEAGRLYGEGPQHRVTIARPFAVGKFEVTFAEWDACVTAGGCMLRPDDQGWGRGNRPVINVSWDDITLQYLPWLSRKTDKTYRLLTEAEWEYAARAGTTTPFWWGSSISTSQANYDGQVTYGGGPKGEYRQKTVPVDSFAPNRWGLYNAHGNVSEWVQDCWNDAYRGAPSDGSIWAVGICNHRVLRGGSWLDLPKYVRSAFRFGYTTGMKRSSLGFRVARTP